MDEAYKKEVAQLAKDYKIAIADATNEYNKALNKLEKATMMLPDAAADFYLGNTTAEEVMTLVEAVKELAVERDIAALAVARLGELFEELKKEYEANVKS